MKTTTITTLCLALSAGLLPSQHLLPTYRTPEVVGHLSDLDIESVLRTALNSAGDRIGLELKGGGSVAAVAYANAGGRYGIAAEVVRTEAGGYEISVADQVAATAGIEVYEGLEVNAVLAGGRKVLFTWDTPYEAARGLRLLANSHATAIGSIKDAAEAQINVFEALSRALVQAILESDAARVASTVAQSAYDSAISSVRSLEGRLRDAQRELSNIRDDIKDLKALIKRTPSWLRGPLNASLRELERALSTAISAVSSLESSLASARRTADNAWSSLQTAIATLDAKETAQEAAQDAVNSQKQVFENAGDVLDAVDTVLSELVAHLSGIEMKLESGAELEASISPTPGVKIENLGMGASASDFLGGQLRWDFGTGAMDERIAITVYRRIDLAAFAGAGIGARAEFTGAIEIAAEWVRPGGDDFAFDGIDTRLLTDTRVFAVVGVGITTRYGIGREASIALTGQQWLNMLQAHSELVSDVSLPNLINALEATEGTFSLQDRWITAVVAGGGVSEVGYGVSAEFSATMDDRGDELALVVNAAEFLAWMMGAETLEAGAFSMAGLL